MLLVEKFFKNFIPTKNICDTKKNTEVLVALSAQSRKEVDEMIDKATAAGGSEYRNAEDHGWMYGRSFEDMMATSGDFLQWMRVKCRKK